MGILFSAGEIFDIAVQIERNGARFYRTAAERAAKPAARRELLDLAAMEDTHEETFSQMKRELVGCRDETDWYDPESEAALYLENFAQGKVFDMTKDARDFFASDVALKQVYEFAIERERDSVVFYVGIKELVPGADGKAKIDAIIRQEMGHIVLLSDRLAQSSA